MGDVIPFKKREQAHRQPEPKRGYCTHWATKLYKSEWMPWPEAPEPEKPDHE